MLKAKAAFSGLSVDDQAKAKDFYINIVGLSLIDESMGLQFRLPGGGKLFVYPKENHKPATYTTLNLVVDDIDKAVNKLTKLGVKFEKYKGFHQDEKGISRGIETKMGPDIAWFKDPAGNILSVLQEK